MPLAASALFVLNEYRACQDDFAKGVLHRLLDTLCRHTESQTIYVSEAAQAVADRWRIGDLRQYEWRDQIRKMGDEKRRVFAWDHFWTVYELRKAIMDLPHPTERSIRKVLKRAAAAWILKREDRKLTELGYQSRRPDPHLAYGDAGIRLIQHAD